MKRKSKLYQTQAPKDNKIILKVKIDQASIPNKMHLNTQINTSAQVFEDRRFKKPKYKSKIYDSE